LSNRLKVCSTKIYEGVIGDVIGNVLHPSGLDLTARAAELAKINGNSTVLDLAFGKGASVRFLVEKFGCSAVGLDLSAKLAKIFKRSSSRSIFEKVELTVGDAEAMPYINSCFDVVMCECSFNLFPDKMKTLSEIHRVLRSGGTFALTDIVLKKNLPVELRTNLTFALCVAGAMTLSELRELLEKAGFEVAHVEDHSEKLVALGLKLLFSDFSALGIENQRVLDRLFDEDFLSYMLIVSHKPQLDEKS